MTIDENVKQDYSLRRGPRNILRESGPPGRRSAPPGRLAALTAYERFSQGARSKKPLTLPTFFEGEMKGDGSRAGRSYVQGQGLTPSRGRRNL